MRRIASPPWCLAKSQLKRAVRAPPRWRRPVGLGAKRVRTLPVAAIASASFQQADRLGGYPLAAAREAEAFARRAADANEGRLDPQSGGEVSAHLVSVVPNLGPLAYDHRIDVRYGPAVFEEVADLAQEPNGVGVLVTGIGVGKVVTDVFEAGGAQNGVGYRVGEYVGVGVSEESPVGRNIYAAQDQGSPGASLGEGVDVYSQPDAKGQPRLRRTVRMASASTRSSGVVSLMLVLSPRTSRIRPPASSTREESSVAGARDSSSAS